MGRHHLRIKKREIKLLETEVSNALEAIIQMHSDINDAVDAHRSSKWE